MLDGIVQKLDAELDTAMAPFAEVSKRLQTMPGVGPIVAATFIASIADPSRFATSGHAASYIGLVPSTYNSGESVRHGRITKRGNSDLRAVLTEAAHHAARPTHPLQPYFARIAAKHGWRKATVTIAHRVARILFQMWKQGCDFDPSKLNVESGERIVEKKVYYTLRKGRRTATSPSAQATA